MPGGSAMNKRVMQTEHMKRLLKMVVLVGTANFLLLCITCGLFMAALPAIGSWQLFGNPPLSHWQKFIMYSMGILSGPASWLWDTTNIFMFAMQSLLNSVLWGLCLGIPIYIFKSRAARSS